jgi:Glycosyltransferase family 87
MSDTVSHSRWHAAVSVLLVVGAAACFVAIVAVRQGPPSGGDTVPLTAVTSELSTGQLRAAAAQDSLPNPPGYALLASPLVVAFRPWVGASAWCTPASRITAPGEGTAARLAPALAAGIECGASHRRSDGAVGPALPPWYRAQGILGLLAWLALALGSLAVLRAGRADSLARQAGLLILLAFLPAASSAIVQLYHPEDILSLGLSLAGLAQTLRRRWLWAGALFGLALLSKQFAILILVPAIAAAPDLRSRARLAATAAVVFGAGILPFLVSAPRATLDNLSGFSAGGATGGSTVLTLSGVTGNAASAVARDAPVVFAVTVCLWAALRFGPSLARPEALMALVLTCVGSRLVFESVVFPYYLLATSVTFFLLDLVVRRAPTRSLAWCAAAAFFVALHAGDRTVDALGTLVLAGVAVAVGLVELVRMRSVPAASLTA